MSGSHWKSRTVRVYCTRTVHTRVPQKTLYGPHPRAEKARISRILRKWCPSHIPKELKSIIHDYLATYDIYLSGAFPYTCGLMVLSSSILKYGNRKEELFWKKVENNEWFSRLKSHQAFMNFHGMVYIEKCRMFCVFGKSHDLDRMWVRYNPYSKSKFRSLFLRLAIFRFFVFDFALFL